jgi:CRISPR/Cas system-associated exonuclease Cas4 (RecB family)
MIAPASYTDLQTFWTCPRQLGFRKLGYSLPVSPEPVQTGQFVHEGLRAFFAGGAFDSEYAVEAINKAKEQAILRLDKVAEREEHQKGISRAVEASNRALKLLSRYFQAYAGDYQSAIPEVELNHYKTVCHIDLIAEFKGELAIVDFKTSKSPDMRWYDISGQCDLYAYILWACPRQGNQPNGWIVDKAKADSASLIIYDIISEEGLFRHIRRPNLGRGKRLFGQIDTLANLEISFLLNKPQYQWNCPRCEYWMPCYIMETGEPKGAIEYLADNYIYKEGKGDAE